MKNKKMGDQQHKCFGDNESPHPLLFRVVGFFERLVLNLFSVPLVAIVL